MTSKRIKIGKVGVNSGTLMVIDPCHIKRLFTDRAYAESMRAAYNRKTMGKQVHTDDKKSWLAVSFEAGFGDGLYEVWGTIEEFPFAGHTERRMTKVEIKLIDTTRFKETR